MPQDSPQSALQKALEAAHVGTFEWEIPTGLVSWSPRHERLWGFAPGTFPGTYDAFHARVHPDDAELLKAEFDRIRASGGIARVTYRIVWPDASVHWIESSAELTLGADGAPLRLIGANWEVTDAHRQRQEHTRLTHLFAALSRVNQAIVWSKRREELFDKVCGALVEAGDFRMCWIGMREPAGPRLLVSGSCGDDFGYLDTLQIYTDDRPEGRGPTGTAFRTGVPYLCNDIDADPATLPWRAMMHQKGIRASAAFPIRENGEVTGTLTVYSSEVDFFQDREVQLLVEAAHDVSYALDGLRRESEHLAAEQSAEAERAFSEQMLASTPGVLFMFNREGRLLRWSKALEQVTGFDATEIAALPPTAFFDEPERAGLQAAIDATFARGGSSTLEVRLRHRSGGLTSYYLTARVVRFQNTDCIVGTGTDISALKQAHRRAEEQAALLDRTLDAVIVTDLEDRITLFNAGAERIYGWSGADVIGTSLPTLLYREPSSFAGARALLVRDGAWSGEQHHVTRVGTDVQVEARWTLLRDDHGEATSLLLVNTDVTERKQIERQFLRAQRMESIGTLAGGIAHDLNNVLAPILTSLGLLKEVVREEQDRRLIDTLQSSAERGRDLVRQVLAFARGVEGQRIPVDVPKVLADLVRVMRETFAKSIEIRCDAAPDLRGVIGDPTQLHQVFLNLFVNARDAMPHGGRLTISALNRTLDTAFAAMHLEARPGDYVVVAVQDTGIGIPSEIRDRIFDPFFTTKDIDVGTGLGLSTTMAIVRSHRGFITVDSEEGRGATFTVFLPAATVDAEVPRADTVTPIPRGNGELILVVDDEPAICLVAQRTLEAHGYRVVTAANGAQAIASFAKRQQEVALVFTDMAMPVMDGPSLIAALKVMSPRVRIVGSSGLDASEKVSRAANSGVVHFIAKPYSAEALLRIVRQALMGDRPIQRGPLSHALR